MKIVVFGASGGTGTEIVKQALTAAHMVTAFVPNPAKLSLQHPHLSLFQGDVMDAVAVDQVIAGQDAVISVLGPARPLTLWAPATPCPEIRTKRKPGTRARQSP